MKKATRNLALALLTTWLAGSAIPALATGADVDKATSVVKSLRDRDVSAKEQESEIFKEEKDRPVIQRNYEQQPPLIPHSIRNYNITTKFNKCLDCHAPSRYKETGATMIAKSHFKDRDGKELSHVTPRRYFCVQCHVPQTDAKPLIQNTYNNTYKKAN